MDSNTLQIVFFGASGNTFWQPSDFGHKKSFWREGLLPSHNQPARITILLADGIVMTLCPIAFKVGLIERPLIDHATLLHHPSGSGILRFTFSRDATCSQNRKLIGNNHPQRFEHISLSPEVLIECITTACF